MINRIKEKLPSSFSFMASLAVHAIVVSFLSFDMIENSKSNMAILESRPIENKMAPIKLEEINFLTKKQITEIKEKMNRQIVASENRGRDEKPVNSRFLGEKNNSVDRQTITRNHGSFKAAGIGSKDGVLGETAKQNTVAEKKEVIEKKSTKKISFSDLGGFSPKEVDKIEAKNEELLVEAQKAKIAQKSASKALGLEVGDLSESGLAANNDHVEDVALGDMTSLNTQEYKYYGFYQRIRSQLEQHWGSSIKDKANNLYRSGRRMPANESMITSISVIINSQGKIIDMKIEGSSGIRELDQAAIESFNKAGPFPNPPKGLLVGGRATIQWGFVVKG